jgi:hypothetical protein
MEIGTEILLKRIQDCPEEFADHDIHGLGRWTRVLHAARECLPKEEIDAIKKAMDESKRQYLLDKFNEQVLKTLAGENTDKQLEAYLTTPTNFPFTGGVINNQSISNSQQYGHGWTDPRGMLSQGGMLNSAQNSNMDLRGQQEMMQKQYNATQKAEKARNAAMQQSGSGLLGKLGFGRWF